MDVDYPDPQGWQKENRHNVERDLRDFAEFFLGELLPEPHSSSNGRTASGGRCRPPGRL
ncbi:MAG: hypothetical protein M3070_05200 [Actinomycetota bacterium]|nr:hypothetical protein [Actinomycetota bacterium]